MRRTVGTSCLQGVDGRNEERLELFQQSAKILRLKQKDSYDRLVQLELPNVIYVIYLINIKKLPF